MSAVDIFDHSWDAFRAAFGRDPLPPMLVKAKWAAPPQVRKPTTVHIEMRRTVFARALITQGEAALFDAPIPLDGRIGVMPMTPEPIRVRITQEGSNPAARHGLLITDWVFEPLPNGPPIDWFKAPSHVPLGSNIVVAWHVPRAERIRLAIIEDGEVADNIGPSTGQLAVPATRPGRVLLRLTAETNWGSTTRTRWVKVVPPRLGLTLLRPAVQTGYPGQTLRFEFKATAAESLWLRAPDADASKRLPDNDGGLLVVTLGLRPVEFTIIARGYGGSERSAVLRAVPDPAACLETD